MINLPTDCQVKPFWYDATDLPGFDFNREIVEPGMNESYPDGALGIRADDDFWTVAVLPYRYKDENFEEICFALWPDYKAQIVIRPDHGSIEQKFYVLNSMVRAEKFRADHLQKLVNDLQAENHRFRTKRPDLIPYNRTRHRSESDYFVQQYEHLLTAFAHEAKPRDDLKGVCSVCDLYTSDRVHSQRYIKRRASGFDRSFKIYCELPEDEDSDIEV